MGRTWWWRLASVVGLLTLLAWSSGHGPRAAAAEPPSVSPAGPPATPEPAESGRYGRATSAGWMGGPLASHPASVDDGG